MSEHKKKSAVLPILVIILLGVVLAFSVMQTVQIKNMAKEGSITTKVASTTQPAARTAAPTAPVRKVPTMVGGC